MSVRSFATWARRIQGVQAGPKTYISPKAMIREPKAVVLGARTAVGSYAELNPQGGRIEIGDDCSIHNFCVLYGAGGISIGSGCRIANGATFVAFNHGTLVGTPIRDQPITMEGIRLEEDVWVGARAIILDGVQIGHGSVIGAGSVISRSVPPNSIIVGSPPRQQWSR